MKYPTDNTDLQMFERQGTLHCYLLGMHNMRELNRGGREM